MTNINLHDQCATLYLITFYIIGLPLSYLVVFYYKLEVYGIWWTLFIISIINSIIMLIYILTLNLKELMTLSAENDKN